MSIFQKLGPIQWNEAIVDREGRMTPRFQRFLEQLYGNADNLNEGKQDADTDLDGIAGLTGTGFVVRTGDATYANRSITVTVGHLTVADGDGVASDTLLGLPDTGVTAGSYTSADITVDAQGRITAAANGASGTFFTDELAQDAVGGILTDSATIDFTYDDATPSITAIVKADSIGPSELADTAVTPGTYGDATNVAQFTVDAQGRLTAAANVAMSGGSGGGYRPLVNGDNPPVFIINDEFDLVMGDI